MRTVENLPIMALNAVLFPGAPTTLYIHEQRYRQMLEEAMEGEGFFGVALLKAGEEVGGPAIPHDVGTIARVDEVTELADGSSVVLAHGGPRFCIDTIHSALPLVRADVHIVEDDAISGEDLAVDEARAGLRELMTLVLTTMGADDVEPDVPDDATRLSYAIAANLQTSLDVQQRLLEVNSPADRLDMELPLLRREIKHYRVLARARTRLEGLGLVTEADEDLPFSRN